MISNNFDKTSVYESLIEEKVNELRRLCGQENIPMFITICLKNNENDTEYVNKAITPVTQGYTLKNDIITKCIDVSLGFDVIAPNSMPIMDFE